MNTYIVSPLLRLAPAALLIALGSPGARGQQAELQTFQAHPAEAAIRAADLEATVRFLAADALAGRSTGSAEAMLAAEGLAARLSAAGVPPGGDQDSYLQRVPMASVSYTALPRLALIGADGTRREAVWGVDFDFASGLLPEGEYELAVVSAERPAALEPAATRALFVDARGREGRELADSAGEGWALVISRGSDRPGREARDEPPRGGRDRGGSPRLVVRGELLELLAGGTVQRVVASLQGERSEPPAANVIGVIAGVGTPERPELAAQAIVFSAHYDHIGVKDDAKEGEDAIYNGADDDASGCAALLELAEAFAAGPPPARTLVFLFATGEEIGLVGTRHYLEQPSVPLEATVCNLNFEMIGRPDALVGGAGKLWLTGYELSNLGAAFATAGLDLVPDQRPEQNFFRRSDNYAFALRGIVAQTLSSYDLHEDYHHVTDEADTLDWQHMEAAVRASWIGAQALADGSIDPAWMPGGNPAER